MSQSLAKQREGTNIEDRLIREGEKKKKRLEDMEKKDAAAQYA